MYCSVASTRLGRPREAFEALLRNIYARFIDRVATGREMGREAVLAAAEGRVMTAQDGKELGLVDGMAGLSEALVKARAAAGLGRDAPVEVWPSTKGMIDVINDLLSGNGGDDARTMQRLWLRGHPLAASLPLEPWLDTLRILAQERVVLIPPYLFSVR
jgi:ClpP class serine protease